MAISTKTRQTHRDAPTAAPHIASAAVLELVLLRVRLRARRRAAWLAYLAGSTRAGAPLALDPTLEVCLDHRDTLEAEAAWYERSEVMQPLNEELEQVEQALAGGDAGSHRAGTDRTRRNAGHRWRGPLSPPYLEHFRRI